MSLTNAQLKEQIFARSSKSQARMPRVSVLLSYAAVFTLIISVVAIGYRAPQESQLANASTGATNANMTGAINLDKPSVDELVATDIAANLAESTNMPVAAQVAELSSSLSARIDLAQTSDTRIDKPQITELISGGKAIAVYKAQAGDSASSVATAHGLTPDTIKWANGLASDAIEAGRDLLIPPVDGVVYTLKAGDTADSLAGTYKADKNRIESFNNVSVEGFNPGQRIVIPGGVLPAEQVPGYQPPSASRGNTSQSFGGSSGYRVNSGIASASAGNRYAFGNCTWYVYERRAQLGRPVGSFWGNANSWSIYAQSAGFTVNNQPATGAILSERSGYYGHVAVVETVNGDGSIVISEMNNYAYGGFNIVNKRTISAGQAGSYTYIH